MTFRPRPSLWFRSARPRGLAWNGAGAKFVVAVLPLMLPTPASNGQEPQRGLYPKVTLRKLLTRRDLHA